MKLLLKQLQMQTQHLPLDTLILLGCGRVKDLPVLGQDVASRVVYVDASTRLEQANRAHLASMQNTLYLNACIAPQAGLLNFYSFNFSAFDGLSKMDEILQSPRNLAQVDIAQIQAICLDQLLEQVNVNTDARNALLLDIGIHGEYVLSNAPSTVLNAFQYIGICQRASTSHAPAINAFGQADQQTSSIRNEVCTAYVACVLPEDTLEPAKTHKQQLEEDILALEWLKIKHAIEIERQEQIIQVSLQNS